MLVGEHRRELSAFSDVLLAVLAYLAVLRWHLGTNAFADPWYADLLPLIVGSWWLLSVAVRSDIPYRLGGTGAELADTLAVNGLGALLLIALSLLARQFGVSRLVLVGFPLVNCAASSTFRLGLRAWLALRRRQGRDLRQVLLVGPAGSSLKFAASTMRPDAGLRPVGLLLPPGIAAEPSTLPVLGDYTDLASVLHNRVVDQLAITAPLHDPNLRALVDTGIREGKTLWLVLDAFGARVMGRSPAGQVVVLSPYHDSAGLAVKRLLDIAVAATGLLLALPVLGLCALAIKLDDPAGPVIFRQPRVGLHGRQFTCLKLRSMVRDAETRRAALLALNEMHGPVFKIRDDPRITRVGRLLRKYSLDELPQLWNVLRGDMSLVGPRPPLPDEVRQYAPDFRRRLAFRPGLTCLWQVSGRNRVDFSQWMELDLRYVDNWSLWLDLLILARTIPTVLLGSGS